MTHTYLFEAKSIQSYIFTTNKLKEIIGGSELIEKLTAKDGLLSKVLEALELTATIQFSRRASAVFYAFSKSEDAINTLSTIWPLVFRQYAPDMEFIHAKAEAPTDMEAFTKAHEALMADRNRPKTKLPQANVYTLRFARTGEPACTAIRRGEKTEFVDLVTARKYEFANGEALIQRINSDSSPEYWPLNLTHEKDQDDKNFPFKGNDLIGLIHADGNGLGQLFISLKEHATNGGIKDDEYIPIFRAVSESTQIAIEDATRHAIDKVLEPNRSHDFKLYPARPIVLGGDDLTMIVRADLALSFTTVFLTAFEIESGKQFATLRANYPSLKNILPEKLTACAGIVYAKPSQPFSDLHDLADSLCKYAKKAAKNDNNSYQDKYGKKLVPSSLSFYRVTSTLMGEFKDILKYELTANNTILSRGCYTLDKDHPYLPKLTDLLALQQFLEQSEISQGTLRQITALLHQSPAQAQRRYERWKEVMIEREPKNWKEFSSLLSQLSQFTTPRAEFDTNEKQAVPFEDVLSLSAVSNTLDLDKGAAQ